MALTTYTETNQHGAQLALTCFPRQGQKERIKAALGVRSGGLPQVDEQSLTTYYRYLSAALSLPFAACYPEPKNAREQAEFRLSVIELLDPEKHLGDCWDGIFCKTRKGKFEVNLPLIELEMPENSPQYQMIEDYCYWFCNWR